MKKKVYYLQALEHRGHVKGHTHRRRVWGEREHASRVPLLWGSSMRAYGFMGSLFIGEFRT